MSLYKTASFFFLLAIILSACTSGGSPTDNPVGEVEPGLTSTPQRIPLVVFAAGSLIIPFDGLEAAFEAHHPEIDVLSEYHGSIQVMRHVTDLHEPIDVVATADSSLIPMLMYASTNPDNSLPYANWFIEFASNHLAIAYQPESKYLDEIYSGNWFEVLSRPEVRLGLADPRFDASGYRALMAFALAEEMDLNYTYFAPMFNDQFTMPITIFRDDELDTITVPEVLETRPGSNILIRGASIQLVALLQSGDIDYAFEYESVIRQQNLGLIKLPEAVNLGEPAYSDAYQMVQVNLDFQRFASVKPEFRGEQIGYGITIPSSSPHPEEAAMFIKFLLSPEGRQIMESNFHPMFDQPVADGYDQIPENLQPFCSPSVLP